MYEAATRTITLTGTTTTWAVGKLGRSLLTVRMVGRLKNRDTLRDVSAENDVMRLCADGIYSFIIRLFNSQIGLSKTSLHSFIQSE